MFWKFVLLILSTSLLTGCFDELEKKEEISSYCDSSSGNVSGCWIVETCEEFSVDQSVWRKLVYNFGEESKFETKQYFFSDSSCTTSNPLYNSDSYFENLDYTYGAVENVILEDGRDGFSIELNSRLFDKSFIFHVNIDKNERLCSSSNIDLYQYGISYVSSAGLTIDYDRCLVRHSE